MQKIGRPEIGGGLVEYAAKWWSTTTDEDYLRSSLSRRDLWWVLLPLPHLLEALANRDVTEIVVLDAAAAGVLLMASFLPVGLMWSDAVVGAIMASRMVVGNIVVPGSWSPFLAPQLTACFAMACAGIHSSAVVVFAVVAAIADMFAASPGFEEAASTRSLACLYVVVGAFVTEHRIADYLLEQRVRGYRALTLRSRERGGDTYYAVQDASRIESLMSRNTADPLPMSDGEGDPLADARVLSVSQPDRALSSDDESGDEERGYVPGPSARSLAESSVAPPPILAPPPNSEPSVVTSARRTSGERGAPPPSAEVPGSARPSDAGRQPGSARASASESAAALWSARGGAAPGAPGSARPSSSAGASSAAAPGAHAARQLEEARERGEAAAFLSARQYDQFDLLGVANDDLEGALSAMEEVVNTLGISGIHPGSSLGDSDDELQHTGRAAALVSMVDAASQMSPTASPSPIPEASLPFGSPPLPPPAELPELHAIMLGGFKTEALNALFVENPRLRVNGRVTFWNNRGDHFVYFNAQTSTWGIARASRLERIRAGQSNGMAHSPENYNLLSGSVLAGPKGWKEWDAERCQWVKRPGSGLQERGKVRPQPTQGLAPPRNRSFDRSAVSSSATAVSPPTAPAPGSGGPSPTEPVAYAGAPDDSATRLWSCGRLGASPALEGPLPGEPLLQVDRRDASPNGAYSSPGHSLLRGLMSARQVVPERRGSPFAHDVLEAT